MSFVNLSQLSELKRTRGICESFTAIQPATSFRNPQPMKVKVVGDYVEQWRTQRRGVIQYISKDGAMMVILFDEWQEVEQKGYEGLPDGCEEWRRVKAFQHVIVQGTEGS